LAGVNLLA